MGQTEPLLPGNFYHIYNRGVNKRAIFLERANYEHFLRLYDQYIYPVADTYAWVLMNNHFHYLVRIREDDNTLLSSFTINSEEKASGYDRRLKPSTQFGHLFNAYTKAFNKWHDCSGGLFEKSFKRILVANRSYFRSLIYYIHNNPVKHGICESMSDYPWSSYLTLVSLQPTSIQREKVMGWFDSRSDFIRYHSQSQEQPEPPGHLFIEH